MGLLKADKIIMMVERALNYVDHRLMEHGIRVAMLVNGMLDAEGVQDSLVRKNLSVLALLHDIGAYRTEEIDKMVSFETENMWEHSIYGYLVLREFTPLKEWAKIILYHHASAGQFPEEPEQIRHYAQIFHVADRVDIFWENSTGKDREHLKKVLQQKSGSVFSPDVVALFWKAEEMYGLLDRLDSRITLDEVLFNSVITGAEAINYLELLVFSIDFRSHFTVTHTMNTIEISCQLAKRLKLQPRQIERVKYGALMHDLGKIGTPLSILEKPGRLTDQEMEIMREHVEITGKIIEGCVDEEVARIAVRHHEKLDGSGYPAGLTAEQLNIEERIVAVADIISALCGTRSYKDAFPKEKALKVLDDMCNQGQLDRQVVAVVRSDFDAILNEAGREADSLLEAYDRLAAEYEQLMKRLIFHENHRICLHFCMDAI